MGANNYVCSECPSLYTTFNDSIDDFWNKAKCFINIVDIAK